MHFRFCWEFKNCRRPCSVSAHGTLFCWRAMQSDFTTPGRRCDSCDYRRKWIDGEFSLLEVVQRSERRARPRASVKVLVVDDEPYLRYALMEMVTSAGFEGIPADDGEEGLFLARETRPNLVISDVIMPRINGYELCRALKTHARTRHIPVILLTVRGTDEDRREGEKAGADAYLTKPFRSRDLAASMAAFLPAGRDGRNFPRRPPADPIGRAMLSLEFPERPAEGVVKRIFD